MYKTLIFRRGDLSFSRTTTRAFLLFLAVLCAGCRYDYELRERRVYLSTGGYQTVPGKEVVVAWGGPKPVALTWDERGEVIQFDTANIACLDASSLVQTCRDFKLQIPYALKQVWIRQNAAPWLEK